jgi:putative ABC transport system permease protein
MDVPFVYAGGDYFSALGIRIVRGTELGGNVGDTLSRVVINESMSRRYWPGRDPVGSVIHLGGLAGRPVRVIAVAADARLRSLSQPPTPHFVVQSVRGGSTLLLRTASAPGDLISLVRGTLGESNAAFVLRRLRTMDEILAASVAEATALAAAVAAVSALALALAVFGLYGVVSYVAAQRTREFGIRMALGASTGDVLRLVLFSGMRLAIIGGVLGLLVSVAASAALHGFLFSVGATEIPTLAAVAAIMAIVAVVACLIPAIRATAASPVDTLRAE